MNCCCRSAIPEWDCPGTRQMRSLTPSLPPRLTAPAWDCASAARLSNRMVAACGRPITPRAAHVFVSPCPTKPRQKNDTRIRSHSYGAESLWLKPQPFEAFPKRKKIQVLVRFPAYLAPQRANLLYVMQSVHQVEFSPLRSGEGAEKRMVEDFRSGSEFLLTTSDGVIHFSDLG